MHAHTRSRDRTIAQSHMHTHAGRRVATATVERRPPTTNEYCARRAKSESDSAQVCVRGHAGTHA